MATKRELPPIPSIDQRKLASQAYLDTIRNPKRVIGISITKGRSAQDVLFDEPVDVAGTEELEALIVQKTGKSRGAWKKAGYEIDINASQPPMGTHFYNGKEAVITFRLTRSPWRELGDTQVPKGHRFSLFQDEEAVILGWLGNNEVTATHTKTRAEVRTPQPMIVDGLDGSPRSLRQFLAAKQKSLNGLAITFSPVSQDTWHYTKEE